MSLTSQNGPSLNVGFKPSKLVARPATGVNQPADCHKSQQLRPHDGTAPAYRIPTVFIQFLAVYKRMEALVIPWKPSGYRGQLSRLAENDELSSLHSKSWDAVGEEGENRSNDQVCHKLAMCCS